MRNEKSKDVVLVVPNVSNVEYAPAKVRNSIGGRLADPKRLLVLLALIGSLLFWGLYYRPREHTTITLEDQERSFSYFGIEDDILINMTETRPLLPADERQELERHLLYAAATQCRKWRLKDWSCGYKCVGNVQVELIFDDKEKGGYGFVGVDHDRKEMIVGFKGSESLVNWIMDLRYAKLDYEYPDVPGAAVHSGFYHTYEGVASRILWQLRLMITRAENPCRGYNLVIVGHSLGGALGSLLAVDVERHLLKPILEGRAVGDPFGIKLTTMGQPRVGNDVFTKLMHDALTPSDGMNHKVTRVTHANDPVPRLPPTKIGFIHHPHEVWVKDMHHSYTCNDEDLTEDNQCINSNRLFNLLNHIFVWDVRFDAMC